MGYVSQFRGLPRQIYILGFIRFLVGVGGLVASFSSMILTQSLGLSTGSASIVVGSMAVCNAIGTMLGGRIADTIGRKKAYIFFCGVSLFTFLIAGLNTGKLILIPFLISSMFCVNACGPAVNAIVADCTGTEKQVESFSFLYLCVNIGFAFGPALGGLLFYKHLPWLFWGQGIAMTASAVILLLFVKEDYDPSQFRLRKRDGAGEESSQSSLKLVLRHKLLVIFILCLGIVTICYQMLGFMLPLQMTDMFGVEISSLRVGNTWTVNSLVVVFATPFIVTLGRRHHHFQMCVVASLFYAFGYLSYAFITKQYMFLVVAVIWSIGEVMISTGAGAFIASQSPPSHLARFQSLYDTARFLGRAISPPLSATMMKLSGYGGAWRVDFAICFVIAAVFFVSYRLYLKHPERFNTAGA